MNQSGQQILDMEDSDHAFKRSEIITDLYECCLQLALEIVKSPGTTLTSPSSQRFRTQVQKLSLWGNDFDVSRGYLHQQLLGADRLSNALLSILNDLARTLITLAQHFPSEDKLSKIHFRANILKTLASEAASTPTPYRDNDGVGIFAVDELSSSESEGPSNDKMDQLEDLIKDFQFHNDCLYGLGPVLQSPAEKVGYLKDTNSSVAEERGGESVSGFAWSHSLAKPEEQNQTKKNRSKWASEENVGQEELYEAVQKVLNQLRSMEEYTDLISMVSSKKESIYYNTIKRPTDLGAISEKLNLLAYRSKQDFVGDLDYVWQNYLKHEVDPEHPFRVKALHMREEAEKLIHLIPNIIIRDRADVEAVERRLHNKDIDMDEVEDSDDEPIIFRRKWKAPPDRSDSSTQ